MSADSSLFSWGTVVNVPTGLGFRNSAGTGTFVATALGWSTTGRLTTTDGVTSGTDRIVGGTAFAQSTPTTVTNTVSTEQTFGAGYTIPANTLKAGSRLKVTWHGEVTASAGADTLTIKVYVGGALVTTASVDTSVNDKFAGDLVLVSSDAPGASVACYGFAQYTDPAATTWKIAHTGNGGASINTNAAVLVKVTATWSATTATNTAALDLFTVEIE